MLMFNRNQNNTVKAIIFQLKINKLKKKRIRVEPQCLGPKPDTTTEHLCAPEHINFTLTLFFHLCDMGMITPASE